MHAAFLPFGPIVDVRILMDNKTGETRGAGFVEFEDVDDAAEALFNMEGMWSCRCSLLSAIQYLPAHAVPHCPPTITGSDLYGRTLKVRVAQGKMGGGSQAVWSEDKGVES